MLAQSPLQSTAVALPLPVAATDVEVEHTFSLNRIAAALQVVLATRRAARNEEHAYWYTVARGL